MAVTTATVQPDAPYERVGVPTLGFRNYWYPVLPARKLGRRPRAISVLGEQIVLFRDGGKLYALENRCPHRGIRLSAGSCRFPGSGTISCAYHGWTFRGADGSLAAALMEGPNAPIERKVRVQSYPVTERAGVIWLFVGDMAAVPLEDDLPDWIHDQDRFFQITYAIDYRCNWRAIVDNWTNDHHAAFVHGYSPELIFQPHLPFAQTLEPQPLADGGGMKFPGRDGIRSAEFPGLGRYPRRTWHRFMKPTGRGASRDLLTAKARDVYKVKDPYQTRLPGLILIGRPQGEYTLVQWVVPLDAGTTRLFNINCFRRHGWLRGLYDRAHYTLWRRWAHDVVFSGQDKRILEQLIPGEERLSRTDIGVIAWRKFAGGNARKPDQAATRLRAAGD
jgi:phenylpropionate dioxygenase-like ring-hydroxylating dioxygenase large terminal subunit